MHKSIRPALSLLAIMTFMLGLIYPLSVWVVGQLVFPHEANGSILTYQGKIVGSEIIGQSFTSDRYFWSRPSATSGHPYDPLGSGASNLNPRNPVLIQSIRDRADIVRKDHGNKHRPIPADLVTASGSGLDPHISIASALYQVDRIAKVRNLNKDQVIETIALLTEEPTFGFLGEKRVNVLLLNIALDRMQGGI